MARLHLILAHSKGQGQGQGQSHTHFNSEYLGNGDRYGNKILLPSNGKLHTGFRLVYLQLI